MPVYRNFEAEGVSAPIGALSETIWPSLLGSVPKDVFSAAGPRLASRLMRSSKSCRAGVNLTIVRGPYRTHGFSVLPSRANYGSQLLRGRRFGLIPSSLCDNVLRIATSPNRLDNASAIGARCRLRASAGRKYSALRLCRLVYCRSTLIARKTVLIASRSQALSASTSIGFLAGSHYMP